MGFSSAFALLAGTLTGIADPLSSPSDFRPDDDRVFFPYLVGRGAGELAATWFSGRDETLHAHVARFQFQPGSAEAPPQVLQSTPFQLDAWTPGDPPTRDTAGEYVPVTFLQDGTLAVATPIQDARGDRWGFSWWRLEAR